MGAGPIEAGTGGSFARIRTQTLCCALFFIVGVSLFGWFRTTFRGTSWFVLRTLSLTRNRVSRVSALRTGTFARRLHSQTCALSAGEPPAPTHPYARRSFPRFAAQTPRARRVQCRARSERLR